MQGEKFNFFNDVFSQSICSWKSLRPSLLKP